MADERRRCAWSEGSADYVRYHDEEWGRPVHGDTALFERITLEAFQSGLAWITILRKREHFRTAFAGFDIPTVAAFTDRDRARLMGDAGIVRNARKIDATIANARALATWLDRDGEGALDRCFWSLAPASRPTPATVHDIPASTPESVALSRALKARGLGFVGPTTMYAAMQACGVVDDHVAGCWLAEPRQVGADAVGV